MREEDQPIGLWHAPNSNKLRSNVALFTLARHSHHRAQGDAQFCQLRSSREAATPPFDDLTSMLLVYGVPGQTIARAALAQTLPWPSRGRVGRAARAVAVARSRPMCTN